MRAPLHHILARPRPDTAWRKPSSTGFRGSRDQRGPASEPAPLRTPRIFVSSRRRRHAIPRVLITVLLWAAAVSAVLAAVM
jgi:hypothetical protein